MFGERLRTSMLIAGVSVSELARKRKVSTKTVRDWLAMKEADLRGKQLVGVCILLRVSIIWLATGVGSPEPMGVANQRELRLRAEPQLAT